MKSTHLLYGALTCFFYASPLAAASPKPLTAAGDGFYRSGLCHAQLKDNVLSIGNGEIERKWVVNEQGSMTGILFKDVKSGVEWMKPLATENAAGASPAGKIRITAAAGQAGVTEEPSLNVTVSVNNGAWIVDTHLQIFEAARGVLIDRQVERITSTGALELPPVETQALSIMESIPIESMKVTRVKYLDSTDSKPGPLVFEYPGGIDTNAAGKDPEAMVGQDGTTLSMKGNVFFLENEKEGDGLLLVKFAPLPGARPPIVGRRKGDSFDVELDKDRLKLLSNEISSQGGRSYRSVVLAYEGGRAGRIATLQLFYRQLRKYDPTRDGLFLTNTWGGHPPLTTASIRAEIDAGARLGADVIQIDDGWQKGKGDGKTALTDPEFWKPNPKNYPTGLKPLVDYAQTKGLQFGIWFSPTYPNDFKEWEKDRDILLDLYRDSGITFFKVDKLNISSRVGEANFIRLIESVIEGSQGRAVIDLDVTLGARLGYFGLVNHGPLFVENRYSRGGSPDGKGAANTYYPDRTLRNFWLLSQYVDPIRLRMEFLNNERDADKYGDNSHAPAKYPPDTLFAAVMFGSPLGWFANQSLPLSYFEKVTPLIKTWKAHREAIVNGSIIPVGEMPDGQTWSGFVSTAQDRQSAYALVFRELNENAAWSVTLPLMQQGASTARVLAGDGQASIKGNVLTVTLPSERTYLFVRVERQR